MLRINNNIIHLNCSSVATANTIKNEIPDFLKFDFYPKLEILLNHYDTNSSIWRIDKLAISISIDNSKQWKETFSNDALKQVRLYLRQYQPYKNSEEIKDDFVFNHNTTHSKSTINLIIHFFKTGQFPKQNTNITLAKLFQKIQWNEQNKARILKIVSKDTQTLLRFIFSTPRAIIADLFGESSIDFSLVKSSNTDSGLNQKMSSDNFQNFITTVNRAPSLPKDLKENLRKLLSTHFNISEPEFKDWLKSQTKITENKFGDILKIDFKKQENDNSPQTHASALQDYYIGNAGLIILHPFLFRLFKRLEYLEPKSPRFLSNQKKHRALLITQYLIQGEGEIFENDIVLNKILCGCKPNEAINTEVVFTDQEKELCFDLLKSVISHWKILKNTSPKTLRSNFLQRNGRISKNAKTWELSVEQSGIDVLLAHLPWGFGSIRTPWMKYHLTCNWL